MSAAKITVQAYVLCIYIFLFVLMPKKVFVGAKSGPMHEQ